MSSSKNFELKKTDFLSKSNSTFIDEMYMKFVNNDPSLPNSWRNYFNEIGDELETIVDEINGPSWSPTKKFSVSQSQAFSLFKLEINPQIWSYITNICFRCGA